MKSLTSIAAASLVACAPAPTPDPLTTEPFCDTEHSVPTPYRGCTTIRGDFIVADDDADCTVRPMRYCCLSSEQEVYVSGTYTIETVEASANGCNGCDGTDATHCD